MSESQPPSEFDAEFRAFALAEKRARPPRNALLFYGSSSIRFWTTLENDFPGIPVINRGFGGSTLAEGVREMPRLLYPLKPCAVVLYAGENDLNLGASPEQLLGIFKEFARQLELHGGPVPFVFISIKPSPARAGMIETVRRANALVCEEIRQWPYGSYLDVFSLMLDARGNARHEFFSDDWLHMSGAGYRLWSEQLRERLDQLKLWRDEA